MEGEGWDMDCGVCGMCGEVCKGVRARERRYCSIPINNSFEPDANRSRTK